MQRLWPVNVNSSGTPVFVYDCSRKQHVERLGDLNRVGRFQLVDLKVRLSVTGVETLDRRNIDRGDGLFDDLQRGWTGSNQERICSFVDGDLNGTISVGGSGWRGCRRATVARVTRTAVPGIVARSGRDVSDATCRQSEQFANHDVSIENRDLCQLNLLEDGVACVDLAHQQVVNSSQIGASVCNVNSIGTGERCGFAPGAKQRVDFRNRIRSDDPLNFHQHRQHFVSTMLRQVFRCDDRKQVRRNRPVHAQYHEELVPLDHQVTLLQQVPVDDIHSLDRRVFSFVVVVERARRDDRRVERQARCIREHSQDVDPRSEPEVERHLLNGLTGLTTEREDGIALGIHGYRADCRGRSKCVGATWCRG